MTVELTDRVVRISASYGIKLPSKDVAFASEDVHISISEEGAIPDDADRAVVLKEAQERRAELMAEAKLAAFGELGVDFKESDTGVLTPDLSNFKAASKPASGGGGKGYGKGGGSKGGYKRGSGSSSSRGGGNPYANLPRHELSDGQTLLDLRPRKEKGEVSEKAADFKIDGKNESFWLYGQDGTPNGDTIEWLIGEGVITEDEV